MNKDLLLIKALITIQISAFLFIPVFSIAQNLSTAHIRALELATSLKINESVGILNELKKQNPEDPFLFYLEDYQDFLIAFVSEDKIAKDQFEDKFSERIKGVENSVPTPFNRYLAANMYLHHLLLRIRNEEYLSSASAIAAASRKTDKDYLPSQIILGVLSIITGAVPDQYKNILSVIGFNGDIEKGIDQLKTVIADNSDDPFFRICRLEAMFYLAAAGSAVAEDKETGYRIISSYLKNEKYPDSPLFTFAKAQACMNAGKNDEALETLSGYSSVNAEIPFYYLDYLKGKLKLNRLDPDAGEYFKRYLSKYKNESFVASSWQRLGWISLLNGDHEGYERCRKMVLSAKAVNFSDKQAVKEMSSADPVSVPLLKARLLCDGGYYEKALRTLMETSLGKIILTKRDQVEYNYRMGRIWQGIGNSEKAIFYFDQAARTGSSYKWYFAASSLLQKGLILERQGKMKEAEHAYLKCLETESDEYKTALDQKARAGIKRTRKNR